MNDYRNVLAIQIDHHTAVHRLGALEPAQGRFECRLHGCFSLTEVEPGPVQGSADIEARRRGSLYAPLSQRNNGIRESLEHAFFSIGNGLHLATPKGALPGEIVLKAPVALACRALSVGYCR